MRNTSAVVLSLLFAQTKAVRLGGDDRIKIASDLPGPTYIRLPSEGGMVSAEAYEMTQEAGGGIAADRSKQLEPTSFV